MTLFRDVLLFFMSSFNHGREEDFDFLNVTGAEPKALVQELLTTLASSFMVRPWCSRTLKMGQKQ